MGSGKIAFELGNVANVRTTERIDRLVGVTDDGEGCPRVSVVGLSSQLVNECVLRMVSVLILVHQDVTELLAVHICHMRKGTKQEHGLGNQVIEVERVCCPQSSGVFAEYGQERGFILVARVDRPRI